MSEADFEAFFARHWVPLVRTLWGYCGDRQVAEECAQEAMARTSRDWEKVQAMRSPGGWLYRVGFNAVNQHFRRRRFEREALDRQARLEPPPDERDVAGAVAVRRAMRGLPSRQRQAVVLFYFADLTVEDVAAVMDVPEGTVKSWLHRGRGALRERLESGSGSEEETSDVR